MQLKPWDGQIHFMGEPDTFARTRALYHEEESQTPMSTTNALVVLGSFMVLAAGAAALMGVELYRAARRGFARRR